MQKSIQPQTEIFPRSYLKLGTPQAEFLSKEAFVVASELFLIVQMQLLRFLLKMVHLNSIREYKKHSTVITEVQTRFGEAKCRGLH